MAEAICSGCGTIHATEKGFCGKCGKAITAAMPVRSPGATSKLIDVVTATLDGADPARRLMLCAEFFGIGSDPADNCVAWAMKFYCHAQLQQLDAAVEAQENARREFAGHLGLTTNQAAEYFAEPLRVDPLRFDENLELRIYLNEPHLAHLFQSHELTTTQESFIGDTPAEKAKNAMQSWSLGCSQDSIGEIKFCSLLAFLYIKLGYHDYAAQVLERMLRPDQFYERMGRPSYPLFWGNVVAGDCYAKTGRMNLAVAKWQAVRSYGQMPGWLSSCERLGNYWIGQAKHNLTKNGIPVPGDEQSRQAQEHLSHAWQWITMADDLVGDADFTELGAVLQERGDTYRHYVSEAAAQVGVSIKLDPFARLKVTAEGESTWIKTEDITVTIFHMRGMVYLALDSFDAAILEFQQSLNIQPSLRSTFFLACSYHGKGALADARVHYETCALRPATIAANYEGSEETRNFSEIAMGFLNEL